MAAAAIEVDAALDVYDDGKRRWEESTAASLAAHRRPGDDADRIMVAETADEAQIALDRASTKLSAKRGRYNSIAQAEQTERARLQYEADQATLAADRAAQDAARTDSAGRRFLKRPSRR